MKGKILIIGNCSQTSTCEPIEIQEKGTLEEAIKFKIRNTLDDINKIQPIIKERGVIPPNFYKKNENKKVWQQ